VVLVRLRKLDGASQASLPVVRLVLAPVPTWVTVWVELTGRTLNCAVVVVRWSGMIRCAHAEIELWIV